MLRPVEGEELRNNPLRDALGLGASEPIVHATPEGELETTLLPHDHPKWANDAVTVSSRAKELVRRLRPVVVRILGFWDHRVRSSVVAGLRVAIDSSGSYRAG
ncbi:MAG TPA: hypothetical protein VNF68_04820 [Candidatus Baltobacteraceae bacterium]|nr:hypothetical protein [Candidatus Baltobacteraceae bacterium]